MNPADDLTARIRHIAERAQQRQRERTPKPAPQPAPVVRLPLWPAELRTCPSWCASRIAAVLYGRKWLFGLISA